MGISRPPSSLFEHIMVLGWWSRRCFGSKMLSAFHEQIKYIYNYDVDMDTDLQSIPLRFCEETVFNWTVRIKHNECEIQRCQ